MKQNHIRKISFLLNKKEFDLIDEACLFCADADKNLEKSTIEKGKYRITFTYEELDDLAGFIAHCANHEGSEHKQDEWDKIYDKINNLLELSERMEMPIKPKKPCGLKYYIFDVWIEKKVDYKVLRKIQIAETKSLYNFAKAITQAFGFYFDHCFGFYDNFQKYHDSEIAYELFVDIGEQELSPKIKGVKKTKVRQAFKKPGDKRLFLFDYGDTWRFVVELKEIKNAEKWDLKPVILETIGDAPLQYPPCDEDELA